MKKGFYLKILTALLTVVVSAGVTLVCSAYIKGQISTFPQALGVVVSPVQKMCYTVGGFFQKVSRYVTSIDAVYKENQNLKEEISALEEKVREADTYRLENAQLRDMLGLKQRFRSFDMEPAEVIASTDGDWDCTLTISKGTASGVAVGNCVITNDGVVGYVVETSVNYSIVAAVTDPRTEIGILISRNREPAVAEGTEELMSQNRLKISYLKKNADVISGDMVETSGLGGVFPKGLLIGTVDKVEVEKNGISSCATVMPAVDVSAVRKVFVIKSFDIEE